MAKAYLVALQQPHQSDFEIKDNLSELTDLTRDAGIEVATTIVQKRQKPANATFIGLGKVSEIAELLCEEDIVIFDDELSPTQQANLSEMLDTIVIDRTQLILDIFAQRARSKEGKIQVELAQLHYLLPRLAGQGEALSRLGAGIGTRGPGETKLELDRRKIRKRIADLQRQIDDIKKVRHIHRTNRKKQQTPLVALVGYTNAGKSTLLSALTNETAYAANQLFATLDPLIRRWQISDSEWVYLSDTVGFIRKLPHTLVAAFRATLEEVVNADLLLHIIDASHPNLDQQQAAVETVLKEIGCDSPVINVYNKIDKVGVQGFKRGDLQVSALKKLNLDHIGQQVNKFFAKQYVIKRYLIPHKNMSYLSLIHDQGEVLNEKFTAKGVLLIAKLRKELANRLSKWEYKKKPTEM